jgi:hypothetical protein
VILVRLNKREAMISSDDGTGKSPAPFVNDDPCGFSA